MIYVSSGHELGIGLEVFLKAFLSLTPELQKEFTLVTDQDSLFKNLKNIKVSKQHLSNLKINFIDIQDNLSIDSLNYCLEVISEKDVLITLPTSKDQLYSNNINYAGYTEYLRFKFNLPELGMFFKSPCENVLLLSDHIPLREVPKLDTTVLIQKVELALKSLKRIGFIPQKIIFAGINPHAGEGGVLGNEDDKIKSIISTLALKNSIGPISGDTLHYHSAKENLLVYSFHDQGLSSFKARFRTMGINLTLGLKFFRLTVDHGTAFDLYGKNLAEYSGMSYTLLEALRIHHHVNQ